MAKGKEQEVEVEDTNQDEVLILCKLIDCLHDNMWQSQRNEAYGNLYKLYDEIQQFLRAKMKERIA